MAKDIKRVGMGKKLRFSIFHRDGFTCQYCGKRPPEVILEVDHIIAVVQGGKNQPENLITACFDCNRGKRDSDLKKVPKQAKIGMQNIQEKYEQLKEFYEYQKKVDFEVDNYVDSCQEYWVSLWGENGDTGSSLESAIRQFINNFSVTEIKEAICIAHSKTSHRRNAYQGVRYMCGILHTKLRNRQEKNG